MNLRTLSPILLFVAACSGSSGTTDLPPPDLTMTVVKSCCGKPGDTGNELGVGKYCTSFGDCASNTKAIVCSSIQNTAARSTFFCTQQCNQPADGGVDTQCGANARCVQDSATKLYGCVPIPCIDTPPAGCSN